MFFCFWEALKQEVKESQPSTNILTHRNTGDVVAMNMEHMTGRRSQKIDKKKGSRTNLYLHFVPLQCHFLLVKLNICIYCILYILASWLTVLGRMFCWVTQVLVKIKTNKILTKAQFVNSYPQCRTADYNFIPVSKSLCDCLLITLFFNVVKNFMSYGDKNFH